MSELLVAASPDAWQAVAASPAREANPAPKEATHVVVVDDDLAQEVELSVSGSGRGGHRASVEAEGGEGGEGVGLEAGASGGAECRAGEGGGEGHAVRKKRERSKRIWLGLMWGWGGGKGESGPVLLACWRGRARHRLGGLTAARPPDREAKRQPLRTAEPRPSQSKRSRLRMNTCLEPTDWRNQG